VLLQRQVGSFFLGHAVEDARRSDRIVNGAGAANVGSTIIAVGSGGRLAHMVGNLDGAVVGVGNGGEETGELFTFVTSSVTGRRAIGTLSVIST
jgi:hypothetical protein